MAKEIATEKIQDISSVTVASSVMANLLSVTDRRVRDLAQEGILVKSSRGRYELASSLKNYIVHLKTNNDIREAKAPHEVDYDEERALHERAKREKAELELMVIKGSMHMAEDVRTVLNDMLARFRSKVLSMPSKLAPVLVARKNIGFIQDEIQRACIETLEELKDYDPQDFYNDKFIDREGEDFEQED